MCFCPTLCFRKLQTDAVLTTYGRRHSWSFAAAVLTCLYQVQFHGGDSIRVQTAETMRAFGLTAPLKSDSSTLNVSDVNAEFNGSNEGSRLQKNSPCKIEPGYCLLGNSKQSLTIIQKSWLTELLSVHKYHACHPSVQPGIQTNIPATTQKLPWPWLIFRVKTNL